MVVRVPFYTQVYVSYGTQLMYLHRFPWCHLPPQALVGWLNGKSQLLGLFPHFLTLLDVSASLGEGWALVCLCRAHCGESHGPSEA